METIIDRIVVIVPVAIVVVRSGSIPRRWRRQVFVITVIIGKFIQRNLTVIAFFTVVVGTNAIAKHDDTTILMMKIMKEKKNVQLSRVTLLLLLLLCWLGPWLWPWLWFVRGNGCRRGILFVTDDIMDVRLFRSHYYREQCVTPFC